MVILVIVELVIEDQFWHEGVHRGCFGGKSQSSQQTPQFIDLFAPLTHQSPSNKIERCIESDRRFERRIVVQDRLEYEGRRVGGPTEEVSYYRLIVVMGVWFL